MGYAISVRFQLGVFAGQKIFVNGSAWSAAPVRPGTKVFVSGFAAECEVIGCDRTSRAPASFGDIL